MVDILDDPQFDVEFVDTNDNGLVDRIQWVVPQLSEKEFAVQADITDKKPVDVPSKLDLMKQKLDGGFYDKVLNLMNSRAAGKLLSPLSVTNTAETLAEPVPEYYDVIILPLRNSDTEDLQTTIELNKDQIVDDLLTNYNAKNVYKGQKLSFVTASVPVIEIPILVDDKIISLISDGELSLNEDLQISKQVIYSIGISPDDNLDGFGTKVAQVEFGIDQTHPNIIVGVGETIVKQTFCTESSCITDNNPTPNSLYDDIFDHGTHVAGIIAGKAGAPPHDDKAGVAPGTELFNVKLNSTAALVRAFDWAVLNDADIVNMSLGIDVGGGISELCKDPTPTVAVTIIADEVVDAGVLFVKSAGNRGSVPPIDYTITSPGCGYNVFTIGNLNDMDTPGSSTTWKVHGTSSRGPSSQVGVFTDERIKPEVVAPGSSIFSHNNAGSFSILSEFDGTLITGTSFAAPHVTCLASLIKQANPTFTPIEMKSAIIAGADWANPLVKDTIINPATPFTAVTYESLTGIGKTNFDAWGLGLINATKSIDMVRNGNVILDKMLGIGPANKLTYTFTVTSNEVNQEQRIILTWLSHGFSVPLTNPVNPQQLSNLTLSLQDPSALIIADSTSKVQNNEFVIFTPTVQ